MACDFGILQQNNMLLSFDVVNRLQVDRHVSLNRALFVKAVEGEGCKHLIQFLIVLRFLRFVAAEERYHRVHTVQWVLVWDFV